MTLSDVDPKNIQLDVRKLLRVSHNIHSLLADVSFKEDLGPKKTSTDSSILV
jgi:hypothetical protein